MTTTEELLKEYANIAGKNEEESEARKKFYHGLRTMQMRIVLKKQKNLLTISSMI